MLMNQQTLFSRGVGGAISLVFQSPWRITLPYLIIVAYNVGLFWEKNI